MTPRFQCAVGFSKRLILPAQEGLKGFFHQLLGVKNHVSGEGGEAVRSCSAARKSKAALSSQALSQQLGADQAA